MVKMKMKTSSHQSFIFSSIFVVLVLCSFLFEPIFCDTIEEECTDEFAKVGKCIDFSTGKATTPTKECCSTVKDIREEKPVCLCYIILSVHKGTSALKNLGLKEDKLLELPNVCKLADTSVEHCPKLLNLPPSSPDNAIFTSNSSSPAAPTTTKTPTTPTTAAPSTSKNDTSAGFMNGPVAYAPIIVLVTVFASLFPTGFI